MEDGALAHRDFTTKQWYQGHFVKHIRLARERYVPGHHQIESLWSQVKQLQSREGASSMAGLKSR